MIIYGTDTDNPLYAEICDFYYTIFLSSLSMGLSHKAAKARTYDAIELRYCIRRSRAEQIVYAMMKDGGRKSADRTVVMANNKELIAILEEVNDAYSKSK